MKRILTAFGLFAAAGLCAAEDGSLRIRLISPLDYQVVQRSTATRGTLIVAGSAAAESKTVPLPDELKVLVTGHPQVGTLPGTWQPLPCDRRVAAFRGELPLPAGGWYRLELRAFRQGVQVASAVVEHVGVGETFVIAGQSNSANYGEERQETTSGLVATFDETTWHLANDPQPGAGGTKGSFMPRFGDEMVERFRVPIGLVATGIGSTSVREWLPAGSRLQRLPTLTRNVVTTGEGQWEASGQIFDHFTARLKQLGPDGFRAVLWHQGESDAQQADAERTLPGALYRQYLEQLIRDSRQAIGWDAPWFVAQVSYHNPTHAASPDIRAAQKSVWESGLALPGPDTDTLTGDLREKDGAGIHLSAKGLQAHAHLWVEKVSPWLAQQLVETGLHYALDVAKLDRPRVLKAADTALTLPPVTITAFRAQLSEGGPNDFYSNGDYWWPDPAKTNGLPYIQRDGESNPNNFTQHRRCILQLRDAVAALAAAYKLTGDDRYATKAAELLRVFFLDPKTRMNPNLKYAQAIPGRTPGRGTGIIDTLHLVEVPLAIEALQRSPVFPLETLAGLKAWFRDYAEWMTTSKNGQEEAAAGNNHAVAFFLQIAVFAEFTGDDAKLAECRRRFKEVFVAKQMAPDGSFPAELKRTKPYCYSIFQLDNMAALCQVLSTAKDNLWAFSLPDGRGIHKAMQFLYPYLADKSKWPHKPDVQAWNAWPARQPALLFAGLALGEQAYLDLWQKLPADPADPEVRRNIAITQPLLWHLDSTPAITSPAAGAATGANQTGIRTPEVPLTPRINGPSIIGVRPGSPFLYHIPATGDRPMEFSVEGLPAGLRVDTESGDITGSLPEPGRHLVTLRAKNAGGISEKHFRIVVGDTIALTPPMGWNSWNCWGSRVDAGKVLKSARGMVSSGLINHGWTYINIDDAWQGKRGGPFNAIQGNEKFPDMKGLCDTIHKMGLKVGIYSTPWTTSYANYIGGSAENPEGAWDPPTLPKKGNVNKKILPWAIGKYSFAVNDAKQWAAWGMDYLKYDWNPNELPETQEMYDALRKSGRDIILSLSNSTPFTNAPVLSKIANCWRTTGDIRDNWASMSRKGFGQDTWEPFAAPGHWNDPDMLVVGYVGWGTPHPTNLTPDEQYTHITLWCLLSAPLLLGCDLERLDEFTLNLLANDEVLAVNQDALGKQALCVAKEGDRRVYAKDLEDGSKAVGLFNLGQTEALVEVKWSDLRLSVRWSVRNLWRQTDLGQFDGRLQLPVRPHGAELVKIAAAK